MEKTPSRRVLALSWTALLLASALPRILCYEGMGGNEDLFENEVRWLSCAGLFCLLVLALMVPSLRVMRDILLVLLALVIGLRILAPSPFVNEFINTSLAEALQGTGWSLLRSRFKFLVPALLMTVVVVGRFGWRELFLTWGKWRAPVRFSPLFPVPVRNWATLLLLAYLLTLLLLGALLCKTIGWKGDRLGRLPEHLPAVLAVAAFNAAAEEFIMRMIPLAVLIPLVGPAQAISMTAVLFGLEHWFGQPSGPLGVLLMTYGGWVLAKSMVETGGSGWALCLHVFGDVLVFSLLVMSKV